MEKQFVPYAESLALKELGFDEPCLYGYDTFQTIISISAKWENWNKSLQLVSAPLWQQAFDWFREKHDMRSGVCGMYMYEFNDGKSVCFSNKEFETHGEAKLECLRTLIEIVKKR